MTRKRPARPDSRVGNRHRRAAETPPRRRRPAARRAIVLAVLAAAALGAWFGVRAFRRGSEPKPVADARDWDRVHAEAIRLGLARRYRESADHFEQAAPGFAGREWGYHYNYAACLNDLTLMVETVDGRSVLAVRTSVQRVRLIRRSLAELDQAERLARTPADRVRVHHLRAQVLQVWGLPWDALVELRKAEMAEPARRDLVRQTDTWLYQLEHPRTAPSARGHDRDSIRVGGTATR